MYMKKLFFPLILLTVAACGSMDSGFQSAWNEIDYSAYEQTLARAPIRNGRPVYIKAISLTGSSTTSLPAGARY